MEEQLCSSCRQFKNSSEFKLFQFICEQCRIDKEIIDPKLPTDKYSNSVNESLDKLNQKEWVNYYTVSISTSGSIDNYLIGHISLRKTNDNHEWYDTNVYYCSIDTDPLNKKNWRLATWHYSGSDSTIEAAKRYLRRNGFGNGKSRWKEFKTQ
ncbi:hypothetical protein [Paenibacillus elgii]|uniref:hypothetical protein n=1 Tax=Paenibacillus elgii TaxID=189691 RepID=UPI001112361E|nr:hypothetical protein [Paenibacillus elgii]